MFWLSRIKRGDISLTSFLNPRNARTRAGKEGASTKQDAIRLRRNKYELERVAKALG